MTGADGTVLLDYRPTWDKPYLDGLFRKLGLAERLTKANYVVIKPNFAAGTYAEADSHVVTDLKLMGSIVEYVLSVDPDKTVYIAESDSAGFGFAFLKFENLGLPQSLGVGEEALKRVKLLDLSRDLLTHVEDRRFRYFKSFDRQLWLSKTLMESDFVIDATNLKTHSVTGFTGACKNLFGTLYPCEKWVFHTHLPDVIHDLVLAVRPALSIVDAFYGMEYNGPVAGKKVCAGYRVWSDDPVAADVIACRMIERRAGKVKHLRRLIRTTGLDAGKTVADTAMDAGRIRRFHPPVTFLRIMNRTGLFLQRIGEAIQYFGHRIHVTNNLFQLLVAIARPMLMAMFGREKLVKIKRRLLGEKK